MRATLFALSFSPQICAAQPRPTVTLSVRIDHGEAPSPVTLGTLLSKHTFLCVFMRTFIEHTFDEHLFERSHPTMRAVPPMGFQFDEWANHARASSMSRSQNPGPPRDAKSQKVKIKAHFFCDVSHTGLTFRRPRTRNPKPRRAVKALLRLCYGCHGRLCQLVVMIRMEL